MSISRTLMVLAAAAAPVLVQAQSADPAPAGDAPIVLRPTVENDSLWTIMKPTVATGQVTHSQAVVAVLRQNPQAFVRGNLHALRKGVALTIPSLAQIKAESRTKADHLVNEHLRIYEAGLTEASPAPYPLQGGAAPASAPASAPVAAPVVPPPASAPARAAQGSAASVPASAPPVAVTASVPARVARASAASAPVSAPVPVPVVKASAPERAASKEPAAAASAVTSPVRASAPVMPASVPAPAPVVASAPAVRVPASAPPVEPKASVAPVLPASAPVVEAPPSAVAASTPEPAEAPQGGSFSGLYLAGLALAAAMAGGWLFSRRRPAVAEPVVPEIEPAPSPEPRLVQISTAAVDMARSLDAMQPVYDLVRPAAPDASVRVEAEPSADATLKLELARACIEVRRHDEAYALLQFVLKHGSDAQQQEARELLRGSD